MEPWAELQAAFFAAQPAKGAKHVWSGVLDRARTLLSARPEVTREAVREWYWNGEGRTLPFPSNENAMTTLVLAAISHFAPPPAPLPISGMSVEELQIQMLEGTGYHPTTALHCARVAHRLAQPAPVVDPDAEAKNAYTNYQAGTGVKAARWEDLFECDRNGWRAVAAAQKEKP